MEYYIFVGVVIIGMIALTIKSSLENKKAKEQFAKKLAKDYGKYPDREYKQEQYANIPKYYLKHKADGQIDDITWNDLDMDRLFVMMNHTYSSAGEEFLYYTLRTPKKQQAELDEMNRVVEYFMEHKEDRVKLQLAIATLGRTGKYSLYDYLDYLGNLGERNNKKQYMVNFLYVVFVLLIPFSTTLGILLLISLVVYNMSTYFKEKGDINPYITSFSYIARMIKGVAAVEEVKVPIIAEYQEKLLKNRKIFSKFNKNIQFVSGDSATGSPLDFIVDYLKMLFHLDIIKFNSLLSEVRHKEYAVDEMVQTFGFLESVLAIGAFRASLPYYCIPHFGDKYSTAEPETLDMKLQAESIYHPYITDAVSNSIQVKRGVLLTGSNASGKSTFLKTIALNAVMAQTVNTATAKIFTSRFYQIYSSMALRDDLESGESYYIVEIKSLKRILDAAQTNEMPVLCFVDEVLRGTNTVERIAASTQILKSLSGSSISCFAATHDIELTTLLEECYDNYHFTEEVSEGDVLFNYKLLEGKATTRNAIKLLSMIGYREDIIEEANKMAEGFVATGKWKV